VHQRGPDPAFDPYFELGELEWRGHHLLDSFGRLQRVFDAASQGNQHAEFITAGAGKDVACAQCQDQAAGEGDQQFVAGKAAIDSLMREKRSMSTISTA
jgi:hypothetical protein